MPNRREIGQKILKSLAGATKRSDFVYEIGPRDTSMGPTKYVVIYRPDHHNMTWREVYDKFSEVYPDKWAVQFFPPKSDLLDLANWYHLYVLEHPPVGVNIMSVVKNKI